MPDHTVVTIDQRDSPGGAIMGLILGIETIACNQITQISPITP